MRLHNFHLTAVSFSVWKHRLGISFCHMYRKALLLFLRKAGSWPCTLTSDLPLQGAHWYSQKLLSMEEDHLKKENPSQGLVVLPLPPLPPAPLSGGMQVRSSPTIPGLHKLTIFHVYLMGPFLLFKAAFYSHVSGWEPSILDLHLINLWYSCV